VTRVMDRIRKGAGTAGVLIILALAGGCSDPMRGQGRMTPFGASPFFKDGASARPLVPGTVPQGFGQGDEGLTTGKVRGTLVQTFPIPVTHDLRERGRERYDIFCAICHGPTGEGDGVIVKFRFTPHPPSYRSAELRAAPVGHFFDVITNGHEAMYGYGDRIPPMDRWAIAAYIRVLQSGQSGSLTGVLHSAAPPLPRLPR
jgi:mono/diheme cytochrome c family protein